MKYYMHISSVIDDMMSDMSYIKGTSFLNDLKKNIKDNID